MTKYTFLVASIIALAIVFMLKASIGNTDSLMIWKLFMAITSVAIVGLSLRLYYWAKKIHSKSIRANSLLKA